MISHRIFKTGRSSITGSRWSITPEESHNLAAENFLALLNIQSKCLSVTWCSIRSSIWSGAVRFILVSGGSNSTSTASSPLNEVSSLGGALPTVSYVLTPTVQLQDHS